MQKYSYWFYLKNTLFCNISLSFKLWYISLGISISQQNCIGSNYQKQKAAIRLVSRPPYNGHTEPLFKKQEILRFEDLYTSNILQFMHRYMSSKLPRARFPLHLFSKVWNEFSDLELKSTDTFKNGLKSYFLDDLASEVKCNRAYCTDCFPIQI